jgi:ATP-dependent Clp protease ATP-binding subunit ClpC
MPEFSEACQHLFLRAGELAHERGHEYVGTEPLLLALLEDPAGRVAALCRRCGGEPDALRADVLGVLRSAGPPRPGGATEPTRPAREVLELARAEAESLGGPEVSAEHLLLGMLRQGAGGIGVAGVLLARRGLSWEAVRAALGRA